MTTYTFTWDVSTWGTSTATWSSPGVHSEITGPISATGAVTVSGDLAVIESSGTAAATSSALAETTGTGYVDPTGAGIWVSATTARVWSRLPACYRNADQAAPAGVSTGIYDAGTFDSGASYDAGGIGPSYPLLRWLACMVDQAGYVEGLINRFSSPTSSDLVNPQTADAGWLPWLGALVGVNVPLPVPDIPEARTRIANAIVGTPKGSKGWIVDTVKPLLGGTQTVTVSDHYGGNPWEIEVNTLAAETPATIAGQHGFVWGTSEWGTVSAIWGNPDPIVWYLQNQGLEPAGFTFVHTTS